MAKNPICLWYEKDAKAAAQSYAKTFPGSAVGAIHRASSDYPSGKWGISWQITPRVLTEALAAGGEEAKRAWSLLGIFFSFRLQPRGSGSSLSGSLPSQAWISPRS